MKTLSLVPPLVLVLRSILAARQSRVVMDHYDYPQDNQTADAELGHIGKKTLSAPGARRGGLYGTVQQT